MNINMKKYRIKVTSENIEPLIREAHFPNMNEAIKSTLNLCALHGIETNVKIEIKNLDK